VYGLLLVSGETVEEVLFVRGLLLVRGETVEEVVPFTGTDEVAVVIGALDVLVHPPLPRRRRLVRHQLRHVRARNIHEVIVWVSVL